jgi:hypothetical protein
LNEFAIVHSRGIERAASGTRTTVQAKNLGGLRSPSGSRLSRVFESGRMSAELKEGGIDAARSGTATAQQAVQGASAQQLPWGQMELSDDRQCDGATDIKYRGEALGAACSGMSFAGGVTCCATGPGAGWWPAWAEATDGASRSATMTAAAPTMRANRCLIPMPSRITDRRF